MVLHLNFDLFLSDTLEKTLTTKELFHCAVKLIINGYINYYEMVTKSHH